MHVSMPYNCTSSSGSLCLGQLADDVFEIQACLLVDIC